MLSKLLAKWGVITGKDQRKTIPVQQVVILGRVSDHNIVNQYGSYCDLPNDAFSVELGEGKSMGVTAKRPDDTERGEPSWFHPETNTRIIARNNGDLDIHVEDAGSGSVNITVAKDANITVGGSANLDITDTMTAKVGTSVTFDTPLTTFTGDVQTDKNFNNDGVASFTTNITSAGTNIGDQHGHKQPDTGPNDTVQGDTLEVV